MHAMHNLDLSKTTFLGCLAKSCLVTYYQILCYIKDIGYIKNNGICRVNKICKKVVGQKARPPVII